MAVSEQTPLQEYTANGIAKQFDLEFDCESADHLIVSIDDLEVLHTDWYLSGNAIMFHVAPANGKQVKIQRNTPFNRLADYQSYNNSFRPPAINKDFDRIWWKLQELGVADWILSNRISALKAYVDDRDDELRAYLMEEIRKQGVALDQLDDYYNYLMQRLAQIAVDKGWDASFVVDASGLNQQEINALTVTPYHFGAIGDGVYHPLSEQYTTLADAQVKYPTAQSLADSIDLCALEAFFSHCHDNLVSANITLNAYVNRPLYVGMVNTDSNYKTRVFEGDLSLVNNQTDVDMPFLMRICLQDSVWNGKLSFLGNRTTLIKDRKQLGALVIGGANGSNRTNINAVFCESFKNFGVRLLNTAMFVRINATYFGYIGSVAIGQNDAVYNHVANISARTDTGGDYGQNSILTVSSLPSVYDGELHTAKIMAVFDGDPLPYRVQNIDTANSTITVYPMLDPAKSHTKVSYIYGAGLLWTGNNAGVANIGQLQCIVCGIGLYGAALYGANIGQFTTESCGVGITVGEAAAAAINYTINNGYFETNTFDYVAQWGTAHTPMIAIGNSTSFNIDKVAELQSFRFGSTRPQNKFVGSTFTIGHRRYEVKDIYSTFVDLSDPQDFINVMNIGGDLLLTHSKRAINDKFEMRVKTLVITQNYAPWVAPAPITIRVPNGWYLNGVLNGTLTTNPQKFATVLTVVHDATAGYNNQSLLVHGDSLYKTIGTTPERPANAPTGFVYIDTSLVAAGKPIYKTASGWVDSAGGAV